MKPILIYKGDDTIFADLSRFLTFNIETNLDLTGWKAKFTLGWITKEINDISSKSFEIILSSEETKNLRLGSQSGSIVLTDSIGHIKTITNSIPFEVTTQVVENQYQEINLTIPESSGVDIKLKVGSGIVTSINGKEGDVILTAEDVGALPDTTVIPDISNLATKTELQNGLNDKQDKGDYALKSEIPTDNSQLVNGAGYITSEYHDSTKQDVISDLGTIRSNANLVTTKQDIIPDLATIRSGASKGATALQSYTETDPIYTAEKPNLATKTELQNGLNTKQDKGNYALKSEIPTKVSSLTNDKGYQTASDVAGMIASIPQFELRIVEELPATGQKMVLYLVPKTSASGDNVYNEYIWIESTSSFELVGSTTVDLGDYYTKTDTDGLLELKQDKLTSKNAGDNVIIAEKIYLPSDYVALEYIETDGNSYIDTNILLSNTSKFEITFQSATASLNSAIMGAISGGVSYTSTGNFSVTYTTNGGLNAYAIYCDGNAGNVTSAWYGGDFTDKLKHTIKYRGLNIPPILDETYMKQEVPVTLVQNTPTVTTWLFGRNNTGSGSLAQAGVRIYDLKVENIAHFIPAKRNSDNAIGMYDTVTDTFFTNAGTGAFIAGGIVEGNLITTLKISAIVPTKTSELTNDSNFITSANVPTKTSQLTNDSGFVTQDALLEKTSETWTFTLEDGTEVTKTMVLGA